MKATATFAYFPGTGPAGKVCWGCAHYRVTDKEKRRGFCDKARQFIDVSYPTKSIPCDTSACKYFEQKAEESAVAA